MVKIRELLAGLSLLVATGMVAAGPQGSDVKGVETDCPGAAAWMEKAMGDTGMDRRFVEVVEQDNISGPADSMIEEYLTFHAQAREESGKFSVLPWSVLRTHAN